MAHHKSARKRIRRNGAKTQINIARRSRVRSFLKQVELAIAAGDRDAARDALKSAQPEIMRGVTKGVLHRNTAARRIGRLNARIKAMG
ncbi:MAG: 30S ribosomal protein S20 [Rhodospirillaceae bacterium]|nr:30S ribosomal protein S20 [Rhodospirillaceae bacterium]MXW91468.1 30S ribosomal protein S20 [Rhodospirillaceae bacterium]MYB13140.1 30S ribosomal protein S20 [Rhodospirillaceae bacterium]MYI48301.1 30S ribosomal protein S20 [Rhodospirillaceae bacterium]